MENVSEQIENSSDRFEITQHFDRSELTQHDRSGELMTGKFF